jgi:hypothetical protein
MSHCPDPCPDSHSGAQAAKLPTADPLRECIRRSCTPLAMVAVMLLAGCATPQWSYAPPAPLAELQNVRVVNATYDRTWTALIDFVSDTFFTIEGFEKESGLLTLGFASGDASRFVDCGLLRYGEQAEPTPYGEVVQLGVRGRMNLFVERLAPEQTRVRVTARYEVSGQDLKFDFTSTSRDEKRSRRPMPGTHPMRICQPNHAAEREVLRAIESIAKR